MNANYAEIFRVGNLEADFQQVPLVMPAMTIFPGPTLLFPKACFLVSPFSKWVMGFTTVNMIKNGHTILRKQLWNKKTWNIMLYKGVADSEFIFFKYLKYLVKSTGKTKTIYYIYQEQIN